MKNLTHDDMLGQFRDLLEGHLRFQNLLKETIKQLAKDSPDYYVEDYENAMLCIFNADKIENISFLKLDEFFNNYNTFIKNMQEKNNDV